MKCYKILDSVKGQLFTQPYKFQHTLYLGFFINLYLSQKFDNV